MVSWFLLDHSRESGDWPEGTLSSDSETRELEDLLELVGCLELGGRNVAEGAVKPLVVVSPDPPGDRDLEL